MGYEYHLDLTPEQKALRRQTLDRAAYTIILSQILVVILLLALPRVRHPRPYPVRYLTHLLTTPLSSTDPKLRCLGDWLLVSAWTLWCFLVAFRGTGTDQLHLTKSFGIVGVSNFPLHFLLSSKHASPLRLVFGTSYEGRVNFLHRWMGRIIVTLLSTHACMYLKFFVDTDRMSTRFLEFDVLCGVVAYTTVVIIDVTAHYWCRKYWYRTFATMHVVLSPLVFPLVYLHVEHARPFILFSLAAYTSAQMVRYLMLLPRTVEVRRIEPGMVELVVSPPLPAELRPGEHVRVSVPAISRLAANPFTPVSAERLVAKVRGDVTRTLVEKVKKTKVLVDVGYGGVRRRLDEFDRVLFVAGGIGVTFVMACLPAVKEAEVKVVWAVRQKRETEWALRNQKLKELAEVYVTGGAKPIEIEEGVELLGGEGEDGGVLDVKAGRPPVMRVIREIVSRGGRTAVLVCGPPGMGLVAKAVVGKARLAGEDVWLHIEEFGL